MLQFIYDSSTDKKNVTKSKKNLFFTLLIIQNILYNVNRFISYFGVGLKNMKKTIFLVSLFMLSLFSCKTLEQIPQDKTAAQIIQMGQNYVSAGDYKSAEFCYQTALERYSDTPSVFVEVKYELGNAYLKQKKYSMAFSEFSQLLNLYDENPTAYPPAYKKLANIGISKIPQSILQNLTD